MTHTSKKDTNPIFGEVVRFYLESRDFNGIPVLELADKFNRTTTDLINNLAVLIEGEKVSVVFGDRHPNPHIRAFPDEPKDVVMTKLRSELLTQGCVYPSQASLTDVVDRRKYEGKPYTLELALGVPQLDFRAFDLSVLEYYRNDPRYYYENDDINGSIGVRDQHIETVMARSDQILLQTFGFCYDSEMNRAVAVFVRYLSDLTGEHQQIWKARELSQKHRLHPDYYRNTILGDWGTKTPIFSAFLEELQVINKMAEVMGRPHLFKEDFSTTSAPREFSFLVRPTLKEFDAFIHLLDKMISDNIDKAFFKNDISFEIEERRPEERTVIRIKGTIAALGEWLHLKFRMSDYSPVDEMISCFRSIRQKRQRPAHAVDKNIFDQKYYREQRELIIKAYESVRILRLVFANHKGCGNVEISETVRNGEIWDY